MAGSGTITVEVTVEQVERLRLADGDILVVRVPQDTPRDTLEAMMPRLVRTIRRATGREDFPIVLCVGALALDCLTEQVIRELGWVRPGEAARTGGAG
jgi:hypothetical protein